MSVAIMTALQDAYNLSNSKDAELLFRWYTLSIVTTYAKNETNLPLIRAFVGKVGRMKMVNPIYKALDKYI
jgi:leukotriene-A4 hydrolase